MLGCFIQLQIRIDRASDHEIRCLQLWGCSVGVAHWQGSSWHEETSRGRGSCHLGCSSTLTLFWQIAIFLKLLSSALPFTMSFLLLWQFSYCKLANHFTIFYWQALPQLTDRDKVIQIMDPRLEGQYSLKEVVQVAAIAAMCVQPEADYRPLMADVVQSLVPLAKTHRLSSKTGLSSNGLHSIKSPKQELTKASVWSQ